MMPRVQVPAAGADDPQDALLPTTPRILIVDDEQYMCDVCTKALARASYEVVATTDPQEALHLLGRSSFDILLTDINMPAISGLELAQQARAVDPAIVIIVMTGHASTENLQNAVRRGVADFLTKPFDLEELRLAVEQALHKRGLLQENLRLQAMIQLLSSSNAINGSLDLAELSRRIIQGALRETTCSTGALLLSAGKQEFGLVQYGEEQQTLLPAGIGLARRARQSGDLQTQHDGPPLLRYGASSYQSGLALPLRAQGEDVGTLLLVGETIDPHRSSYEALGILLNQAGSAIRNAQQHSELQGTYERLQELDHLKSEFIAIASHELRTPLSIVLGYTMMVRDQLGGEQQQYLQRVFENAQRIKGIVDDMVTLHFESEQSPLLQEPHELGQLAQNVSAQLRPAAAAKRQELQLTLPAGPEHCLIDREKFELVLVHLLSNAIKFTDEGGVISVRLDVQRNAAPGVPQGTVVIAAPQRATNDWIIVEVCDNGVGIPPKDQLRVFERFYQVADSLTRDHGGTGLGLAVVKELVSVMGGALGVQSDPGHGSTFRLALPFVAA